MEFGACDLVWSKIKGHRDNLDRLALIPFPRVDDFVCGESNKDCPTSFSTQTTRRKRSTKVSCKPRVDGILDYIMYWCSYGPGLPCHGPQDKHSVGTRAMYAPFISEEFRQRVISLLHAGIPVETIMQRHTESVERQGGPSNIVT
ncbi:hypothetical protein Tco_0418524 [Tanacetum coccineum]